MGFSHYHASKNPLKMFGMPTDPPKLEETSSTYEKTDEGATLTKTFGGETDKPTPKPLTEEQKAASTAYWSSLTPEEKQKIRERDKKKEDTEEYQFEYKKLPYHEPTTPTQIEQADIQFDFPQEKPKSNGNGGGYKYTLNGKRKKVKLKDKIKDKFKNRKKCKPGPGLVSTKLKTGCVNW